MDFIAQLKQLLKPYSRTVGLSLAALMLGTALQLSIPAIIRQVIDHGLTGRDPRWLAGAAGLIVAIGLLRSVILFGQRYWSVWVAQRVSFDLRNRLYDHIQRLSFSYHDTAQSGQLISRCIEDVRSTNEFMGVGFVEFFQISILLTGITIILFLSNPILAAIAMIPIVPLFLLTTSFGRRVRNLFLDIDQALGELSARLQENVTGAQVVRAFAREPYEIQRFDQANRRLYETRVRTLSEFARLFPTTHLLVTLGTILILAFGGMMVLQGRLTIGEVVAFNAYLLLMANPAQQFTWTVNNAGEAAAGLNRIFEILNNPPEIQSPLKPAPLPDLRGRVEFRDVSFQYHSVERAALRGIDLIVEPNSLVALIGPTGSGKSSLVHLIPRFYDVSQGEVRIDGADIRRLDLQALRRHIGIVLQTSLLFSDSVAENIAFGRPDAGDDEIIAAAKAAQAHEFIIQLPEGYDTIVGERGITLSGGQRQRVAIARALLMNPRILILDDSTSSVDTETEQKIQLALDELMRGRTTFIIAHRLATVRRADLILVMEQGQIVERGTHVELLKAGGLYRQIYELQLRDQEKSEERIPVPAGGQ